VGCHGLAGLGFNGSGLRHQSQNSTEFSKLWPVEAERRPVYCGVEQRSANERHRIGIAEQAERFPAVPLHNHDLGEEFAAGSQPFAHTLSKVFDLKSLQDFVLYAQGVDYATLRFAHNAEDGRSPCANAEQQDRALRLAAWRYEQPLKEDIYWFTDVRSHVLTAAQERALKPGDPFFKECTDDPATAAKQRGRWLFYHGDFEKAAADLLRAHDLRDDAYTMLWLYLARAHMGQDGAAELSASATQGGQ
jgi:hypothetical protein